jgi:hypothetical protein
MSISFTVHGNRTDAESLCCPHDAASNLTTIRNQDLVKHASFGT